MRRSRFQPINLLAVSLALVVCALAQPVPTFQTVIRPMAVPVRWQAADASGMTLQAANQALAIKIYPPYTNAIDGCDVNLDIGGSTTGIKLKIEFQTDSADTPSGSLLGTASAAFSAPAAAGWTGLQNLGSNTGTLTMNVPVWLVLIDGGGTAPTGTNFIQLLNLGTGGQLDGGESRKFNGTNWTSVSAVLTDPVFVCHDVAGHYIGYPVTSDGGSVSARHIFSTNRTGIRFKLGVGGSIYGVTVDLVKVAAPASLDFTLYAGATSLGAVTVAAASILNTQHMVFYFAAPVVVPGGTDLYLILHQTADGGDSSNYYAPLTFMAPNATYLTAFANGDFTQVYGTNTNPTLLTVDTSEYPQYFAPLLSDPTSSLANALAGFYVQ